MSCIVPKRPINWNELDSLIDKDMNVKKIAKYYNFSYTYFIKRIKEHLDIPLSVYIAKRRKNGRWSS